MTVPIARRAWLAACVLLLASLAAAENEPGAAPETEALAPQLVDRILAVVDDDPILASEVGQVIGLGLVARREDEADEALRRRVLDLLIEERLRFHEIDRFGFAEVPVEGVERQVQAAIERLGGPLAAASELARLGLDEDGMRQILARQFMVLTYVEERLGPRIFVSIDDIRQYYQETLTPAMRREGRPVPPIDEVREQVRGVLKESRLNEEIARWTAELREEADVLNYFDRQHPTLPPPVATGEED